MKIHTCKISGTGGNICHIDVLMMNTCIKIYTPYNSHGLKHFMCRDMLSKVLVCLCDTRFKLFRLVLVIIKEC